MRILAIFTFLYISTSLIGCSSMRGNVVPQTGPSMEQVYDEMGHHAAVVNAQATQSSSNQGEIDIQEIRKITHAVNTQNRGKTRTVVEANAFRKLPNPELTMFVYPHLAGNAEIPIPGYSTVFHAYSQDHYVLPQEFY